MLAIRVTDPDAALRELGEALGIDLVDHAPSAPPPAGPGAGGEAGREEGA